MSRDESMRYILHQLSIISDLRLTHPDELTSICFTWYPKSHTFRVKPGWDVTLNRIHTATDDIVDTHMAQICAMLETMRISPDVYFNQVFVKTDGLWEFYHGVGGGICKIFTTMDQAIDIYDSMDISLRQHIRNREEFIVDMTRLLEADMTSRRHKPI